MLRAGLQSSIGPDRPHWTAQDDLFLPPCDLGTRPTTGLWEDSRAIKPERENMLPLQTFRASAIDAVSNRCVFLDEMLSIEWLLKLVRRPPARKSLAHRERNADREFVAKPPDNAWQPLYSIMELFAFIALLRTRCAAFSFR